jgi:hypothetical protein
LRKEYNNLLPWFENFILKHHLKRNNNKILKEKLMVLCTFGCRVAEALLLKKKVFEALSNCFF